VTTQESQRNDEWPSDDQIVSALRALRASDAFFDEALPSPDSGDFAERCRTAGEAARGLARLRGEQVRVGFVALPFGDYLQGLARAAGVSLQPMLSWAGIADLSAIDHLVAAKLARLALMIGLGFNETLTHLRMTFAAQQGSPAAPLLIARSRSDSRRPQPEVDCIATLSQIEATYSRAAARELHEIEAAVRPVFADEPAYV
jgi:hypothetical protein